MDWVAIMNHFTVKGDKEMKYRIIKRESFKVFGVYAETSTIQAAAFEQVPQAIWPRIYTEWFPDSGYELTPGIQFEMYYGLASHENGFGEIWLPVRQKK